MEYSQLLSCIQSMLFVSTQPLLTQWPKVWEFRLWGVIVHTIDQLNFAKCKQNVTKCMQGFLHLNNIFGAWRNDIFNKSKSLKLNYVAKTVAYYWMEKMSDRQDALKVTHILQNFKNMLDTSEFEMFGTKDLGFLADCTLIFCIYVCPWCNGSFFSIPRDVITK